MWGAPVTIVSWDGATRTANTQVSPTSSQTDNSSARLKSECNLTQSGSGACDGAYFDTWTNGKCIYLTSLSLSGYTGVGLDISLRRRNGTCTAAFYASTDGSTYAASAWDTKTLSNSCTNYNVSVASNVKAIKIVIDGGSGNFWLGDVTLSGTAAASCENKVTISAGTNTNCTFTLTPNGQQESCDGVTTTVSITPTPGYGNPTVTQSGASKTPTISGTGNTRTITYQANTTGTSTIAVSCSANTYTITLNKDLTPTTAGTASITATYNSSNNLTSAITKPTATGWTFGGYYTAKNGGGTQIIDADGNVKANVSNYTDSNKKWIKADNVTLYAKWTRTVTWSVNGLTNVYPASTVTYNATASKVASIPTAPNPASYCGDKFVGWTTDAEYVHGTSPLFTTAADSPDLNSITTDIIFYAVFADYAQQ